MATMLELARIGLGGIEGDGPCCVACGNGAGACPCADIDEKTKPDSKATTYPFDEYGNLLAAPAAGVGDAPVVTNTSGSSGPGFFTGLVIGVLASGAAATLLYVGLSDEGARRATLARRRSAGYAY